MKCTFPNRKACDRSSHISKCQLKEIMQKLQKSAKRMSFGKRSRREKNKPLNGSL